MLSIDVGTLAIIVLTVTASCCLGYFLGRIIWAAYETRNKTRDFLYCDKCHHLVGHSSTVAPHQVGLGTNVGVCQVGQQNSQQSKVTPQQSQGLQQAFVANQGSADHGQQFVYQHGSHGQQVTDNASSQGSRELRRQPESGLFERLGINKTEKIDPHFACQLESEAFSPAQTLAPAHPVLNSSQVEVLSPRQPAVSLPHHLSPGELSRKLASPVAVSRGHITPANFSREQQSHLTQGCVDSGQNFRRPGEAVGSSRRPGVAVGSSRRPGISDTTTARVTDSLSNPPTKGSVVNSSHNLHQHHAANIHQRIEGRDSVFRESVNSNNSIANQSDLQYEEDKNNQVRLLESPDPTGGRNTLVSKTPGNASSKRPLRQTASIKSRKSLKEKAFGQFVRKSIRLSSKKSSAGHENEDAELIEPLLNEETDDNCVGEPGSDDQQISTNKDMLPSSARSQRNRGSPGNTNNVGPSLQRIVYTKDIDLNQRGENEKGASQVEKQQSTKKVRKSASFRSFHSHLVRPGYVDSEVTSQSEDERGREYVMRGPLMFSGEIQESPSENKVVRGKQAPRSDKALQHSSAQQSVNIQHGRQIQHVHQGAGHTHVQKAHQVEHLNSDQPQAVRSPQQAVVNSQQAVVNSQQAVMNPQQYLVNQQQAVVIQQQDVGIQQAAVMSQNVYQSGKICILPEAQSHIALRYEDNKKLAFPGTSDSKKAASFRGQLEASLDTDLELDLPPLSPDKSESSHPPQSTDHSRIQSASPRIHSRQSSNQAFSRTTSPRQLSRHSSPLATVLPDSPNISACNPSGHPNLSVCNASASPSLLCQHKNPRIKCTPASPSQDFESSSATCPGKRTGQQEDRSSQVGHQADNRAREPCRNSSVHPDVLSTNCSSRNVSRSNFRLSQNQENLKSVINEGNQDGEAGRSPNGSISSNDPRNASGLVNPGHISSPQIMTTPSTERKSQDSWNRRSSIGPNSACKWRGNYDIRHPTSNKKVSEPSPHTVKQSNIVRGDGPGDDHWPQELEAGRRQQYRDEQVDGQHRVDYVDGQRPVQLEVRCQPPPPDLVSSQMSPQVQRSKFAGDQLLSVPVHRPGPTVSSSLPSAKKERLRQKHMRVPYPEYRTPDGRKSNSNAEDIGTEGVPRSWSDPRSMPAKTSSPIGQVDLQSSPVVQVDLQSAQDLKTIQEAGDPTSGSTTEATSEGTVTDERNNRRFDNGGFGKKKMRRGTESSQPTSLDWDNYDNFQNEEEHNQLFTDEDGGEQMFSNFNREEGDPPADSQVSDGKETPDIRSPSVHSFQEFADQVQPDTVPLQIDQSQIHDSTYCGNVEEDNLESLSYEVIEEKELFEDSNGGTKREGIYQNSLLDKSRHEEYPVDLTMNRSRKK